MDHARITYEEVMAKIAGNDPNNFASHPDIMAWRPPAAEWLIEGMLPRGYTIMLGAPKTGKTALTLPLARSLAANGYRVLYLAWDDNPRRVHQRLKMADPDEQLPGLWVNWYMPADLVESVGLLNDWLATAAARERPFDVVFVDTYGAFMGKVKPDRGKAFQGDYNVGSAFKNICDRHGVSLHANHHTRKGDEADDWLDMANGTGGIAASADAIWLIRRTRGTREGVLKVTGNDVEETAWPLTLGADMQWKPSETRTVAQAAHRGVPLAVLTFLHDTSTGVLSEIVDEIGANRNTTRDALQQLKGEGLIDCRGDEWYLTDHEHNHPAKPWQVVPRGDTVPARQEWQQNGETYSTCTVCGRRMLVLEPGQTTHPSCRPSPPPPAADPGPPQPGPPADPVGPDLGLDDVDQAEEINGFSALEGSIKRSRMKPVLRIPVAARSNAPWTLITEQMTGEHRWIRHLPGVSAASDSAGVLVLDRNGSYPAAMSSVPVAANLLKHTGSLRSNEEIKAAGLFEIKRLDWWEDGIGHPLGRIAEQDSPTWWISTPHLRLLQQLYAIGRIDVPQVVDSWTGRATGALFERFSRETQDARLSALEADDMDRYAEVKRATSVAIRCLWPKGAGSPFWRPDWSVSVRAEAAVRHWVRADQARTHGAILLKLGAVDEVAMIDTGVPRPYVLGRRYGQVKIKEELSYGEWVKRRGNRAR